MRREPLLHQRADALVSPPASLRVSAVVTNMVRRPLFLLAVLYSIAIAYERVIEVEIFKPYRLLGLLMILGVLLRGRVRLDSIARISMQFLSLGFVLGLFSLTGGGRNETFISSALLWAFNLATFVALVSIVGSRRDVLVLAFVHALAMVTAAYGIALDAAAVEDGMQRVMGDFKNPANATVSMLFACLVLLTVLRSNGVKRRLSKPVSTALVVAVPSFFLFAASLTGTRSGAILMVAGLVCYGVMTLRRKAVLATMFFGVFAMLLFSFGSLDVGQKIAGLTEANVLAARVQKKGLDTDRLYLWRAGFDAFVDTYGLGTGMTRYSAMHKEYFAPYAHLSDPRWMDSELTLHNDFVIALVEYGIVGFALFLLLCLRLYSTARSIQDRHIRAIGVSLLLGMAINGLSHNGLAYFSVWFYFALLSAWVYFECRATSLPAVPERTVR